MRGALAGALILALGLTIAACSDDAESPANEDEEPSWASWRRLARLPGRFRRARN